MRRRNRHRQSTIANPQRAHTVRDCERLNIELRCDVDSDLYDNIAGIRMRFVLKQLHHTANRMVTYHPRKGHHRTCLGSFDQVCMFDNVDPLKSHASAYDTWVKFLEGHAASLRRSTVFSSTPDRRTISRT